MMRTKLAKNVRAGDRLALANSPADAVVTFVQLCDKFKRPEKHDGLMKSGIPASEAIMIEYRIHDGDFKGYAGSAYLRLDQRIKTP